MTSTTKPAASQALSLGESPSRRSGPVAPQWVSARDSRVSSIIAIAGVAVSRSRRSERVALAYLIARDQASASSKARAAASCPARRNEPGLVGCRATRNRASV